LRRSLVGSRASVMAFWSGWLAAAAILMAALVPIQHRLRHEKRAQVESGTTRLHVAFGMGVAGVGFGHALLSLFSLGASSTIGQGQLALACGGGALFVLMAHAGIGFQLRDPKLRKRPEKRRAHVITATTIIVLVVLHAVLLLRGS
jgi:putative copper export protein